MPLLSPGGVGRKVVSKKAPARPSAAARGGASLQSSLNSFPKLIADCQSLPTASACEALQALLLGPNIQQVETRLAEPPVSFDAECAGKLPVNAVKTEDRRGLEIAFGGQRHTVSESFGSLLAAGQADPFAALGRAHQTFHQTPLEDLPRLA